MIVRALFATAALAVSAAASAQSLAPTSYDMLNGETGTYTYWDDSYSGTGSRTTSLSPLAGGLGDLTDGVIATDHWYTTPAPFVGWYSTNPTTITFNFGGLKSFISIGLYFDNAGPTVSGDVSSPQSWTATIGASTFTYTTSATERATYDPAQLQTIALGGITGSSILVTINRPVTNNYFMISEAKFTGTAAGGNAVPEPAAWALMALGFGLTGAALRRRPALRVVAA